MRKEKRKMSYADIRSRKKSASELMNDGKRQLHTADVVDRVLTVIDVDAIMTRNGRCGVISFKEFPDSFYFTGKVLTEMCDEFMADKDAYADLKAGNVQIIISKAKSSSNGNDYITFEYVTDEE